MISALSQIILSTWGIYPVNWYLDVLSNRESLPHTMEGDAEG
ncbi:hypothetical protein Holit_03276 [Hollandina sp. SP2]